MDIALKATMLLMVLFADPEGDGSYNYLFVQKHGANQREYMIAHSYPSKMDIKSGQTVVAEIDASCEEAWALDPVPKSMESALPWGAPRRAYICNANSITIDGKTYQSLVRGKHE